MLLGIRRLAAGLVAAVALVGTGALVAPSASAAGPGSNVVTVALSNVCNSTSQRLDLFGFYVGDQIVFKNAADKCTLSSDQDGVGGAKGGPLQQIGKDYVITLVTPTDQAFIRFDQAGAQNPYIVTVQVQAVPGGGTAAAAPVNYTVDLDPEDGGTCTVEKVTGPAGSWQRLPQESACSKPGHRFVAWEARYTDGQPTTRYPAYSFINLTGNNRLYAIWAPVDAPVVEPVTATRWVVWRWDAKAKQMRPVSADLVGLKPVVTIHAPKAGAVSNEMVEAAKALAAKNGGDYHGIVTSTKWTKPRIVTAYKR